MVELNKVIVIRDRSGVLARAKRRSSSHNGDGWASIEPFSQNMRFERAHPSGLPSTSAIDESIDPEAVQMSLEDATQAQEESLAREPDVVAVARSIPLSIVHTIPDSEVADMQRHSDGEGDPSHVSTAWGIEAVGADTSLVDGEKVTVAVLDTGIDATHAAFTDPALTLVQKNFTDEADEDINGHGTHCAGTIFGRDVDGTRIGVAPGIRRALIGKVIGKGGDSAALVSALQWAIDGQANVISMSLGFDFPAFQQALQAQGVPQLAATSMALQAYRNNVRLFDNWMALNTAFADTGNSALVVAAAGNESNRDGSPGYEIATSSPAAATGIISVGALANGGGGLSVAKFSNTWPRIAAPGVSVVSAKLGGGLKALNGTSMACPHVAGILALHWDELRRSHSDVKPQAVRDELIRSAELDGHFLSGITAADVGMGICKAP